MADTTSPDNIVKWTGTDAASIVAESQAQGASIQNALDKRQRYNYVWANQAARDAQSGMTEGSLGYQLDTKSDYVYDNSNWRLSIAYAEYTVAAATMANGAYTLFGALALDSTLTTDSDFTTIGGNGELIFNDPGVYAFSFYATRSTASGGQSHILLSLANTGGTGFQQLTRGYFTGGGGAIAPMPFWYSTASNVSVYLLFFNNTGVSVTDLPGRLRVGRLA